MNFYKRISFSLLALLLVLSSFSGIAQAETSVDSVVSKALVINEESEEAISVYAEPSLESEVVIELESGSEVAILPEPSLDEQFTKISVRNSNTQEPMEGYILSTFISLPEDEATEEQATVEEPDADTQAPEEEPVVEVEEPSDEPSAEADTTQEDEEEAATMQIQSFAAATPIATADAWQAQYFANTKLQGTPVQKTHPAINFDWGSGSPDSKIPNDYFSARFTRVMQFDRGVYQLVGEVDDHVKVYIDNKLVFEISKAGHHTINQAIQVPVGKHEVYVEYVELTGKAKLKLDFKKPNGWTAKYYSNTTQKGTPLIKTHAQDKLAFDWGHGSPDASIPVDNFSAEFENIMTFNEGVYQLTGRVDDVARVFIDDKLVYKVETPGSHPVDQLIEVPQGSHRVKVQYVEFTGSAKISLDFKQPNGWIAKYYNNLDFKGDPVIHHSENLDFNWGHGSPDKKIPVDNFSATFEKDVSFQGGEYRLVGRADDVARVYIDGKLVYEVNKAGNHPIDKVLSITPGTHRVYVEYKEFTGGAALSLDFAKVSGDGWFAKYYSNNNFKGVPVYYDTPKNLQFDWGHGSPDKSVPVDNFSAEYTRKMDFEGGVYTLTGRSDDLIKVYIDGKLVHEISKPGSHAINQPVEISKGTHEVKVQYVEFTGSAKLSLDFTRPNGWVAKYYKNTDLKGTPVIKEHSDLNFNWKAGSPDSAIPNDYFSASFEKEMNFSGGIYKVTGHVDDKIKIYIDDQLKYQITNPGHHVMDGLIDIPKGNHKVRVEYVELTGNARVSLDFTSPQGWIAKYYKNTSFQGTPVLQEHDAVNFDWGYGSPDPQIPVDNFSATYEKSMSFDGGIYEITGQSDDLVKVSIDGNVVYDVTKPGNHSLSKFLDISKGTHAIKIDYVEFTGKAKLSVDFKKADSGWVAKYYPNTTLSGTPVLKVVDELNFDWAHGSPDPAIPVNYFSASFENTLNFEGGLYNLRGNVDDKMKVFVDGQLVYEMNKAGSHKIDEFLNIKKGSHKIRVEYVELTGSANMSLYFTKMQGIIKKYESTSYSTSLQDMVTKQVNARAQIDPYTYDTYIRSDGFISISNNVGIVDYSNNWKLREGPGTNFWEVTQISSSKSNPYSLRILGQVKGSDGYIWYKVNYTGWQNAKPEAVERLVNPSNYTDKNSKDYLQFLKLSGTAGLDANEVNSKVLWNKGILANKASSFIQASKEYNVNEVYLIAHALLETGNGTSALSTGVGIIVENGKPRLAKNGEKPQDYSYNMYGINAKDSCALECGALYAYQMGWTTPEKAIVGGASFIASGYVSQGQDTIYKMRWNPAAPATHQYATDIGWALKQTARIKEVYDQLNNYTMVFDEPVFSNK